MSSVFAYRICILTRSCKDMCMHVPRGMMERYFPLNLLANVISCLSVQPFSEKAWCAAAGGWWLTWDRVHNKAIPKHSFSESKKKNKKYGFADKIQLAFYIWINLQSGAAYFSLLVHRASGSRILLIGRAQTFLRAEDWKAFRCGGRWWSRTRRWTLLRNTSVLKSYDI